MDLPRKVKNWICQEGLIQQGDHVIAGVSGGADSVCLLLCLHTLKKEFAMTLSAVHVHHGIREEAGEDAAFTRRLCERLKVPLRVAREDVPGLAREKGISLEEAGRLVRYRIFRAEQERLETEYPGRRVLVAVAHHQDDQAETVMMNLCRGTGIRGLGGMPPEQGGLIRPLLGVRRGEIEEWLRQQGEKWQEDATNRDDDYTRNRIRHHLIPWLTEEVNRQSVAHLNSLAAQAREMDAYLEQEAGEWLSLHRRHRGEKDKPGNQETAQTPDREGKVQESIFLPADKLASLPVPLRRRILQMALREASGTDRDYTSRHLLSVDSLLSAQVGKQAALPGGLTAYRGYEELCIGRKTREIREEVGVYPGFCAEFTVFSKKIGQKIPENQYTKWFDYDKIKNDAKFRTRRAGDEIELRGVGKKTVKAYMIDAKIPADRRGSIPVLADGSHIMWIVGYRMSAAYQITEETRTILQVSVTFLHDGQENGENQVQGG